MNLSLFNTANLFESATDLFRQLNIKLNSNTTTAIPVRDLLKQYFRDTEIFNAIEKTFLSLKFVLSLSIFSLSLAIVNLSLCKYTKNYNTAAN